MFVLFIVIEMRVNFYDLSERGTFSENLERAVGDLYCQLRCDVGDKSY